MMGWDISERGFKIVLSARCPRWLESSCLEMSTASQPIRASDGRTSTPDPPPWRTQGAERSRTAWSFETDSCIGPGDPQGGG